MGRKLYPHCHGMQCGVLARLEANNLDESRKKQRFPCTSMHFVRLTILFVAVASSIVICSFMSISSIVITLSQTSIFETRKMEINRFGFDFHIYRWRSIVRCQKLSIIRCTVDAVSTATKWLAWISKMQSFLLLNASQIIHSVNNSACQLHDLASLCNDWMEHFLLPHEIRKGSRIFCLWVFHWKTWFFIEIIRDDFRTMQNHECVQKFTIGMFYSPRGSQHCLIRRVVMTAQPHLSGIEKKSTRKSIMCWIRCSDIFRQEIFKMKCGKCARRIAKAHNGGWEWVRQNEFISNERSTCLLRNFSFIHGPNSKHFDKHENFFFSP